MYGCRGKPVTLSKFWKLSYCFYADPDIFLSILLFISSNYLNCDVGRENIPLVAESEAEKITIIHRAVIDQAFLGLIGFYHFKVLSIDWSMPLCQQITINALNIDFKMLHNLRLIAVSELKMRLSLNNHICYPVICQQ